MMLLTLSQAKSHLDGLRKLAVSENTFLSCVHSYLRNVDTDVLCHVRGDQFKSHAEIAELIDLQSQTEKLINEFLMGNA